MTEQIIEIDENGKVHGNDLEHALSSCAESFQCRERLEHAGLDSRAVPARLPGGVESGRPTARDVVWALTPTRRRSRS